MKKIFNWLSLIIVGATVTYCVYGLLAEHQLTFIPRRAFLCFLLGIANALIVAYIATKRPNKLAD